ncbi:MAG: PLP-dependent cysteine synthase family protein [Sneathiella sp.]
MQRQRWCDQAISKLDADYNRSADTHLFKLDLPALPNIDLYFKDESTHPTGSLKHRLARSLFLYAICNGWIKNGTTIIEASSGSTAVSEAYFAQMLGLPFIAVMPKTTSSKKIAAIEHRGGICRLVDNPAKVTEVARVLAKECNGHFMDQFTYAERATDWRGNNNIAESIFQQLSKEPHPIPTWIVVGAGTGGTSATIGRYIRYQQAKTKLCVVDPENSAFYDGYTNNNPAATVDAGSRIEGIGRPRMEASFIPHIVDEMIKVPDAASLSAMHILAELLGRRPGGSTGTNFYGVLKLAQEMIKNRQTGSIVTLICDDGSRYEDTYYNPQWLAKNNLNIQPYDEEINNLLSQN